MLSDYSMRENWVTWLALCGKFMLRRGWFIALAMLVAAVSALLFPDITTPTTYQATLLIESPLPSGFGSLPGQNSSAIFYTNFFLSPTTLNLVLPKHKGLQLSDLQQMVTATPVTGANVVQLSALGPTPRDATSLVDDIYSAVLTEIGDQHASIANQLSVALTAELIQSKKDAFDSFATLQSLEAERLTSSSEYIQLDSLYREQQQRIAAINKQLLLLQPQGVGANGILKLASMTPQITTIPGYTSTLGQRLALSPLLGLIMGLGGLLLANTFSTRLPLRGKKRGEVLPGIIAIIPTVPIIPTDLLQSLRHASSFHSLLRHLRFQASEHEKPLHVITVTSSRDREGKSLIASGLAVAAARSGLLTLLVDANPQQPVLHTRFRLPNPTGLLDAVRAFSRGVAAPLPILPTGENNLSMVPTGNKQASPDVLAEILCIDGLRPFIESLRAHADLVILDGPALLSDANAINLIQLSDITLLVVDAHQGQSTAVMEAGRLLSTIGASSALVLNQAQPERVE